MAASVTKKTSGELLLFQSPSVHGNNSQILGRWSDTLNTTRPHNASTSRMNVLHEYNLKQTTRKKKEAWLCLGPCHKQENFTITRSKLLSKEKRQSVRHGTIQRKGSTDDHWRLETYTTFMCFQASWRARLCHGGVRFSACPHNTNTRRTTAEPRNQDKWNTTKISEQTSCKCHCDKCVPQDYTVHMQHWSSMGPLRKQENPMSTKLLCKNSPHILVEWCSSRNQTAQTKRW